MNGTGESVGIGFLGFAIVLVAILLGILISSSGGDLTRSERREEYLRKKRGEDYEAREKRRKKYREWAERNMPKP